MIQAFHFTIERWTEWKRVNLFLDYSDKYLILVVDRNRKLNCLIVQLSEVIWRKKICKDFNRELEKLKLNKTIKD